MNLFSKVIQLSQKTILLIWGFILFVLLFLSFNNTTYNLNYVEDNYFINLISIVSFTLIILLLSKFSSKLRIPHFSGKSIALFCFVLGCLFLMSTQLSATSDGYKIMQISREIQEYNFSAFVRGGYIDRYPHQTGLTLFYYIISLLSGKNNYMVIQFINVILFSLAVYYINELYNAYLAKNNFESSNILYLAYYLFIPVYSYMTFVYGTIPGFSFSVFAIYNMHRFFKTKQIKHMLFSVLYITLAIILKTNSLVFWFAILLFAVYFFINDIVYKQKSILKHFIYILLLLCCFSIGRNLPISVMEQIIGMEISEGEPMSSYIVMGLMESAVGPGSHNSYPADVYMNNNYDTAAAATESNAKLLSQLKEYASDPIDAIRFFLRKTAFQWNNPTFRCFTMLHNRSSVLEDNFLVQLYHNSAFISIFTSYLNIFTMFILFGAFLFVILNRKKIILTDLLFAVIFIGGFLFHTAWESSPYYTFPYLLLLFPYAVHGFRLLSCNYSEKATRKSFLAILVLLLALSPIFAALDFGVSRETYKSNEANTAVVESKGHSPLGMYLLHPADNISLYLTTDTALYTGNHSIHLTPDDTTTDYRVSLYPDSNKYTLRFLSLGNLLCIDNETGNLIAYYDDYKNLYYVADDTINKYWEIIPADEDNSYFIVNGETALTHCSSNRQVSLTPFSSSSSQKWVFTQ